MKTQHIVSGLLLICLTALLTGCGKQLEVRPVVLTKTVVEKVVVPSNLLEPCEVPGLYDVQTTGDLERVAQEAISATVCGNEDKAAIKEWQEEEVTQ